MKKIFSLVVTFLLILIMMPVSNTEKVYAVPGEGTAVVYGALIQRSKNEHSGLYSVRQASYQSSFGIDDYVTPSPVSETRLQHAYTDLCLPTTNYGSWTKVRDLLCDEGNLKSAIAQFYLDEYGNLTVILQNDVEVAKLDIYYTIAAMSENDHSSTAFVACKNPAGGMKLCNHAKKISSTVDSEHGNWQNSGKRGDMSFTEVTMEAGGFSKKTNDAGVVYNNYNVIENMPDKLKSLAYKAGAYVVVTMSVTAPDPSDNSQERRLTYHINTMLTKKASFAGVASVRSGSDTTIVSNTNVFTNALTPDTPDADYELRNRNFTFVDQVAGLVSRLPDAGNGQLEKFIKIFEEYIKPILEIALGVLLLVRGTILIVEIVKASDEPDVRRDNIKHLVSMFVSIVIIMVIVWFFADIVAGLAEVMVGFV